MLRRSPRPDPSRTETIVTQPPDPPPAARAGVSGEIQGALTAARTQLAEAVANSTDRLKATTAAITDIAGRVTPGVDEEQAVSAAKATIDATAASIATAGAASAAVLDSLALDFDRLASSLDASQ